MSADATTFDKSYTVHGLRITRVAFVDRGADQDAYIELLKRDDALDESGVQTEESIYKRTFSAERRRELASMGNALPDGSYPIENRSDLGNAIALCQSGHGNVSAAKRLIMRRAKALGAEDMLPDDWTGSKKVEKHMAVDLTKLPESIRKALGEEPELTQEAADALSTAVADAVEAAKAEGKADGIEIGKAEPRPTDEDPYAGMPEALAKRMRENDTERTELQKRLDGEIEKSAIRDATELFKRDFAGLPGEPDKLGALYYRLTKSLDADDLGLISTLFRAGSEGLTQMLQQGEVGSGVPVAKAMGTMEARAQEIQKSASEPMSIESARIQAMSENPEWYEEYVSGLRKAGSK